MARAAVSRPTPGRPSGGFTLIEVMIVLVVVALLSGIAIPTYQANIRRSARAAAQSLMQENAQFMERYLTTNGTYVGATLPNTVSPKTGAARYNLSFSLGTTDTAYTQQAVQTTQQAADPCGTLTLSSTGAKGVSRSTVAACW